MQISFLKAPLKDQTQYTLKIISGTKSLLQIIGHALLKLCKYFELLINTVNGTSNQKSKEYLFIQKIFLFTKSSLQDSRIRETLVSQFKTQTCQKIETQYLLFLNIIYTLPNLITHYTMPQKKEKNNCSTKKSKLISHSTENRNHFWCGLHFL